MLAIISLWHTVVCTLLALLAITRASLLQMMLPRAANIARIYAQFVHYISACAKCKDLVWYIIHSNTYHHCTVDLRRWKRLLYLVSSPWPCSLAAI